MNRSLVIWLTLVPLVLAACQPGTTVPADAITPAASSVVTDTAATGLSGMQLVLPTGVSVNTGSAADQLVAGMSGPMCKDDGGGAGAQAPLPVAVATAGPDEARLAVVELGQVLSTVVDIGEIPRDAASEHNFTLRNDGTGELKIEALSASCGCTKVETDTRTIAPGSSTVLHVVYDPTAAEDKGATIEKKVRIKSNDKQRPFVEFTMTGSFAAP